MNDKCFYIGSVSSWTERLLGESKAARSALGSNHRSARERETAGYEPLRADSRPLRVDDRLQALTCRQQFTSPYIQLSALITGPLPSESARCTKVKDSSWPWLSGKSPQHFPMCSLLARKRQRHTRRVCLCLYIPEAFASKFSL